MLSSRAVRLPPALASRDYRNLLFGQLVSAVGTQMQHVAVVWQLYLFTRSPLALGLLGFFRVAPVIVFALGGGVVADAVDRRRLMLVTQTVLASVSVTLALATHRGDASPGLLYGLVAIGAVAIAFDNPARQALVPLLVPPEHLSGALSLSFTGWQVAQVAGPALGGALLAWAGVVPVYALDAASFLVSALLISRMRFTEPHLEARGPANLGEVQLFPRLNATQFLIKRHELLAQQPQFFRVAA